MKWVFIALAFFALDQATKALVLRSISTDEVVPVIPGFFYLVQVHNTGAAFGMLRDNNLFFVILASVALVAVALLAWKKNAFPDTISRWAATLLSAGIAGNLLDRLIHHHVIDFLDFILPWYGHWPAFNVADSCICAAAGLFIISSFAHKTAK